MSDVDRNVGYGLLYPLRFVGDDFESAGGSSLFKSRLLKVLSVQASTPDGTFTGEYPWRGNFGSNVSRLRHENYGDLYEDLAQVFAIDALLEWEPLAIANLAETVVESEGNGQKARLKVKFARFSEQTGDVVDPDSVETEL